MALEQVRLFGGRVKTVDRTGFQNWDRAARSVVNVLTVYCGVGRGEMERQQGKGKEGRKEVREEDMKEVSGLTA